MSRRFGISDHAVSRFIQRVMGIDLDIEQVRLTIAAFPGLARAAETGATSVTIQGVNFQMRNGTVTTIGVSRSGQKFRREAQTMNGGKIKAGIQRARPRRDNRLPVHLPDAEVDG